MNNQGTIIGTLIKDKQMTFLTLNENLSQSLLAVRLLLAQAEDHEADRLGIIKTCFTYLNLALDDLQKLRDVVDVIDTP